MKVIRFILRFLFHPRQYIHMPRGVRLRTHTIAIFVGLLIMLIGVFVASYGHHADFPLNLFVDAFGYFLHGLGMLPVAVHVEPWLVAVLAE